MFLFVCLFECSHGDFTTIIDLPEGEHQYKYFVDGQWQHNTKQVRKHQFTFKETFFSPSEKFVVECEQLFKGLPD